MSEGLPPEESGLVLSKDPYLPSLVVIITVAVAVRLFLLFTLRATEEDFYITLRYAESIARGHGFQYNPGVSVLGTTTPLYTLLLAGILKLHGSAILGGKLLGVAADALACLFTYRLGRGIGRPGAGLAAALCLAFAPTNLIWSTKGMEAGIVAACAAGTWMAWVEKREMAAWVGAASLILLRIDGAALASVLFAATLLRERKIPWRGLIAFSLLLAPWLIYACFAFGSPLPLSLKAKLIVYGRLSDPGFPYFLPFLRLMFHNALGLLLLIGVGFYAARLARSRRDIQRAAVSFPEIQLAAPGTWLAFYYGAMALSKVFLFGWYFVPPTPLYFLIAFTGWALILERRVAYRLHAVASHAIAPRIMAAGTFSACLLLVCGILPTIVRTLRASQEVEENLRIPIGIWLRTHARPGDTLMLEPIGYIGYYSRLPVIDMVGLVSPEVLPYYGNKYPSPFHALWQNLRPTWLLLRGGQVIMIHAYERNLPVSERLEAQYALVRLWPENAPRSDKAVFALYYKIHR